MSKDLEGKRQSWQHTTEIFQNSHPAKITMTSHLQITVAAGWHGGQCSVTKTTCGTWVLPHTCSWWGLLPHSLWAPVSASVHWGQHWPLQRVEVGEHANEQATHSLKSFHCVCLVSLIYYGYAVLWLLTFSFMLKKFRVTWCLYKSSLPFPSSSVSSASAKLLHSS